VISDIKLWLCASRIYTSPMTIMSWLVIFSYSLTKGGNILYGLFALLGICLAHFATNVFDDYIDFKTLEKSKFVTNKKNGKCKYLLNNSATLNEVLIIFLAYSIIASCIGLFFLIKVGLGVLIFGGIGALIILLYPFLGKFRLCELAVGLAYGPALFGGVYYVMTGKFDIECLIISIPTMILTINLLYTSTILDFDNDIKDKKKTFANSFKTITEGLKYQKLLIILGYLSIFLLGIFDIGDWQIFLTYLTIPLAINLINSLNEYIQDKEKIPERKFFNFPMENWDRLVQEGSAGFMFRMYQARNLMIYFSIILSISFLFG